ncbi:MAG: nucleotidyltransferase domain-containing protein [Nitrososphaerota archaeon]
MRALEDLSWELGAEVFLFGSYARGVHLIDSDVDVIVVSEKFENMNYVDRVALVRGMLPPDISFDVIALTPREFEKGSPLIREASRYWVKVGARPELADRSQER